MKKPQLRVLFVTARLPVRLDTGDRVRSYNFIRELSRRGHHVDLLGFRDMCCSVIETDITSFCHAVRPVHLENIEFSRRSRVQQLRELLVGAYHGYPRRVWQFHSSAMAAAFSEMLSSVQYDVVHFSGIEMAGLLDKIGQNSCNTRVCDLIDAISLSVESSLRYRHGLSWPTRVMEVSQLRRFECKLLASMDAACVVSDRDQAYLARHGSSIHRVRVIPLGVHISDPIPMYKKEFDLLFVGNMSASPNIDAMLWFARRVWPHIVSSRPNTTLAIVGKDPPRSVRSLADNRITVTGTVADTSWYYARARVFVAPMRVGAGQKTKLLEALANALPVVGTNEANQGTHAVDGQSIVLRDNPYDMALATIELLDDEKRRRSIGENALQFVKDKYSWHRAADLLEELYLGAIERARHDATAIS